jgi:Pyruvate/2-oxoacid:ferredoxin oxidoreductase delta subunit
MMAQAAKKLCPELNIVQVPLTHNAAVVYAPFNGCHVVADMCSSGVNMAF